MDGWITFWTISCLVGFFGFYLVVLAIIPLGARDLFWLLRHLSTKRSTHDEQHME